MSWSTQSRLCTQCHAHWLLTGKRVCNHTLLCLTCQFIHNNGAAQLKWNCLSSVFGTRKHQEQRVQKTHHGDDGQRVEFRTCFCCCVTSLQVTIAFQTAAAPPSVDRQNPHTEIYVAGCGMEADPNRVEAHPASTQIHTALPGCHVCLRRSLGVVPCVLIDYSWSCDCPVCKCKYDSF